MKESDWIQLRARLGISPSWEPPVVPKTKPPEPDPPLAASSTGAIAGSLEKIEVMRQRAERGEAIFHPLDNKTIQAENTRCNAG
jgi:hypothetical protein